MELDDWRSHGSLELVTVMRFFALKNIKKEKIKKMKKRVDRRKCL